MLREKSLRSILLPALALVFMATGSFAAETPKRRDTSGMPQGSFAASCTCAMSGGLYLHCFCSNLQAKLFQTVMDVRNCPGPKDIKNCRGQLTCTASTTTPCPAEP